MMMMMMIVLFLLLFLWSARRDLPVGRNIQSKIKGRKLVCCKGESGNLDGKLCLSRPAQSHALYEYLVIYFLQKKVRKTQTCTPRQRGDTATST